MTKKCEFVKKLYGNDKLKLKISKLSYTPPI